MLTRTFSRPLSLLLATASLASLGCASSSTPAESPDGAAPSDAETSGEPDPAAAPDAPTRPELTAEACAESGGTVVGDIGDGAIHRADYRCENGAEPTGSIKAAAGGPIAVEGSVCCPK